MSLTLTSATIAAPLLATFVAVSAPGAGVTTGTGVAAQDGSAIVLAASSTPIARIGQRTGASVSDPTNLGF